MVDLQSRLRCILMDCGEADSKRALPPGIIADVYFELFRRGLG
jgi:hypothetical protein